MGRDAEALDREVEAAEAARRESPAAATIRNGTTGLNKPLVWIDCEMTGLGE